MSWAGIANDNEFYSGHYLAEVFVKDTKAMLDRWREASLAEAAEETKAAAVANAGATTSAVANPSPTPDAALRALARELPGVLDKLARARAPTDLMDVQRTWLQSLTEALSLPWAPQVKPLDDELTLPLLGEIVDSEGRPQLWLLEALPTEALDADPLTLEVAREQVAESAEVPLPKEMRGQTWQSLLATMIYTRDDVPRWILLVSARQWLLLDRAKFAQSRLLRFDWQEILTRRDNDTLKAAAVLLHRDALIPDAASGAAYSLHDTLDENAHKHAYGVSEDLKFALRESIELLGNEAAKQLIAKARRNKEGIYSGDNELKPEELTTECLRYMYRMLFLFYIEARPELGYAPVNDETYLTGYSLEHLRALELVELRSERERDGRYLHDSISTLFRLIDQGFDAPLQQDIGTDVDAFRIKALKSHLFDPSRTALLNTVVFPNHVLQRIIELMSLTRKGSGKKRRGRVSYAQLGINQLGAVYEALLSFRGFFATEELFEVKKKGSSPTALETGYFVNAEALERYEDEEKVFERDARGDQQLKRFPKGTFIYRMAGRDRQQSASYYTPEVLTQCLVKYALKELFAQQLDPLPNDEARAQHLLTMTVCEPAMGSAAFLNEAVNQLADKYLELAQSARGERIPASEYAAQKQKVKMYLADHAVFGIDLNPVAVELAEVSLWLNALSDDRFVPWFGLQLHCGNSLVGARRQTYSVTSLARAGAKDADSWLNLAPDDLAMDQALSESGIWHFLLPDRGMSKYDDKAIKERYPEAIKAINEWRKNLTKKFDRDEIARLQRLSATIEALWQEHAQQRAAVRARTTDRYAIYGHADEGGDTSSIQAKDAELAQETAASGNDNAYVRLKLVMNYWCALWFWPIDKHADLPSREDWLFDLENLLLGDTVGAGPVNSSDDMFEAESGGKKTGSFVDRFGKVDRKRLFQMSPRFRMISEIAEARRFFHWPIEFADIFAKRGGFDLVLGNPPWIKVEWEEGGVLGDAEPEFALKKFSALEMSTRRVGVFQRHPSIEKKWRAEYVSNIGLRSFLSALVNYPDLVGIQANLFKCFHPQAWRTTSADGVNSFLHQEAVLEDPNGGAFRKKLYSRLRLRLQFGNKYPLFRDIGDGKRFGVYVSGSEKSEISFYAIANLHHPLTVDDSFKDKGLGEVPGIKRRVLKAGKISSVWDIRGHSSRIVGIDESRLKIFCQVYDKPGSGFREARLPLLHSEELFQVIGCFYRNSRRLGSIDGDFTSTTMFDETYSQRDGLVEKEVYFPSVAAEVFFLVHISMLAIHRIKLPGETVPMGITTIV